MSVPPPHGFSARLHRALHNTAGIIDLASIMVGVIVLGLVASTTSATTFGAIPWSQDASARSALGSVRTAESTQLALSTQAGSGKYLTMANLVSAALIQPSADMAVGVNNSGSCYVAVSQSATGNLFYLTDTDPAVKPFITGVTASSCLTQILVGDPGFPGFTISTPDPLVSLPMPTSGLVIDDTSNYGGDLRGRDLELDHNGTWTPDQFPYAAEAAVVASGATQATNLVDVHAWIAGKEVPVSLDSSNSRVNFYPPAKYSYPDVEFNASAIVVGDNTNATIRAWLDNGALSYRVDGSTSVNTLLMNLGDGLGGVHFPPSNDGTSAGGDVIPPLTIYPASLPNGANGQSYSQQLYSSASSTATWTVTAGTLPAGLSLDASGGSISGTPTTGGPSTFTVKVADSSGASGQTSYTVYIQNPHAPVALAKVFPTDWGLIALDTAGSTWEWGTGYMGYATTPTRYVTTPAFTTVASGRHSLALDASGNIWSWGANSFGQLGNGTVTSAFNTSLAATAPAQVTTGTRFVAVAVGSGHSLALDESGHIWSWGWNGNGQLGNGSSTGNVTTPTMIDPAGSYSAIAAGANTSTAIGANGTLFTWGDGSNGKLGDSNTSSHDVNFRAAIGGTRQFQSLSSTPDGTFTAALDTTGNLYTWGYGYDSLAQGSSTQSAVPNAAYTTAKFVTLSVSNGSGMALDASGHLYTWGYVNVMQLLSNGSYSYWSPRPAGSEAMMERLPDTTFTSIAAGGDYAAIDTTGALWTFGMDGGSLGTGGINPDGSEYPNVVDSRFWYMQK